jgi:hypothetical protein
MNRSADPPSSLQRRRTRVAGAPKQEAEWERADERLDEELRQTFPASDALSVTQYPHGD